MKKMKQPCPISWLIAAATAVCAIFPLSAVGYLSPLAVVADREGAHLYVAERTAGQVAVVGLEEKRVIRTIALDVPVEALIAAPDGRTVYAAYGEGSGRVAAIDTRDGTVTATLKVGHSPAALAVSPDGTTLYVCDRFRNQVLVVDVVSQKIASTLRVAREPVACALTPDGKYLFVANHLPVGGADSDYVSAVVSVIDTVSGEVLQPIVLPNGSTCLRGLCISPDGQHVYVTHALARYHLPTTQLERGWMSTSAITVIDALGRRLVNTVLLDDVDLGAANPWGVSCSPDGRRICVAVAGTHEVQVIDRQGLTSKLDGLDETEAANVPNQLAFLVGLKRRLKLEGNGPRGLAVVGTKVYVAEYFTDTIGMVDTDPAAPGGAESLALGPKAADSLVRRGERFFNDASLCFQKWQSCATCHPDGRADGLNWDLLNDGMGNPKQAKSLLLAHETPPAMITGVRARAEVGVRAGMRYIQFAVRPEEDAEALDAYLKAMKPVPSPYLEDGKPSPAARRGERVFAAAGCAQCHSGPLFTDQKMHALGLGTGRDRARAFDTPTLVEIWRTAPYMHDGRCASMREVITSDNTDDAHGVTSTLSEQDMTDLEAFILSR